MSGWHPLGGTHDPYPAAVSCLISVTVHSHYRTAHMTTERLLRLPQVEHLTGLRRAHIYGLARRGEFPAPIKIGTRASAWRESQVSAWIDDRIRAAQGVGA